MRRLVFALAALALLAVLVWSADRALYNAPRSPGEMIDHAERYLRGRGEAARVLVRTLEALRHALGEPGASERRLPFMVPPLEPNPLIQPPAEPARDSARQVIHVGPGRADKRIADAARRAVDGSVIEIDPGDYVADVAVWDRASLTIRGLGNRVRLIAAGASAEGKAIWVIRRGNVTVENIEFVGARVADHNGAGIRLEGGHLIVRGCTFLDSESGILTSGGPGTQLDVERSEFGYLGAGDGQSHAIYVGNIDRFALRGSYLHHGNVGHLVKSRARRNLIEYNRITDEPGGRASYEIDLPNGGQASLVGNIVQQDVGGRNSVIVSYGEEGYIAKPNTLAMAFNTVVNDRRWGGSFVRATPGADAVSLRDNLWVGGGQLDVPDGTDEGGNRQVGWPDFARPAWLDYRPRESALVDARLAPVDEALAPRWEYVHPLQLRPLQAPPRFPGALQSSVP